MSERPDHVGLLNLGQKRQLSSYPTSNVYEKSGAENLSFGFATFNVDPKGKCLQHQTSMRKIRS